ncbi:MAG: cbb3-type cytochrome c oxidase subunit 3 [Gammaproteobacteria bacterium]|nr:cbb3-type cytochrome c oxidase subunit 3 [Gammaproteobacteria bacterium]MDH5487316.1 cbb3-type cytochrome c oxidase subunit 3 [Gammaproteobacteria bacterium]
MNVVMFHSWWTVLLVILFIAIVLWAFSSRRKPRFDAAARLPLEEDDPAPGDSESENNNG